MYKAILFSVDGEDYVTDYCGCKTKAEVENKLANQGSRWIFYPWKFIILDKKPHNMFMRQLVVSVPMWPQELIELEGKSLKTVQTFLKENGNRIASYLI
jgi:hypothetical protein